MAVSLVSTGLQFPSGSIQTVANLLPYTQVPILMSEYLYLGSSPYYLPNTVMTRAKLGSLAQAPQIWGDAEFDPTNNLWIIKKTGYYYFNVGVRIVSLIYDQGYWRSIRYFRIHFGRINGSGTFISEQENGWYMGGDANGYPRSLQKDCNFNAYCSVNDKIAIYIFAEAAFFDYEQLVLTRCNFSGHMLRT